MNTYRSPHAPTKEQIHKFEEILLERELTLKEQKLVVCYARMLVYEADSLGIMTAELDKEIGKLEGEIYDSMSKPKSFFRYILDLII